MIQRVIQSSVDHIPNFAGCPVFIEVESLDSGKEGKKDMLRLNTDFQYDRRSEDVDRRKSCETWKSFIVFEPNKSTDSMNGDIGRSSTEESKEHALVLCYFSYG